jgi:hypothetical protein
MWHHWLEVPIVEGNWRRVFSVHHVHRSDMALRFFIGVAQQLLQAWDLHQPCHELNWRQRFIKILYLLFFCCLMHIYTVILILKSSKLGI